MIHETYYHLVERDPSNINKIWKALHITLFVGICLSGFITAVTFANLRNAYSDKCFLNANLSLIHTNVTDETSSPAVVDENEFPVFPPTVATENGTGNDTAARMSIVEDAEQKQVVEFKNALWSAEQLCSFCQFTPIMSMVFGIIWGVFYIACTTGELEYELSMRSYRIVYPLLIFCVVFLVFLSSSAVYQTHGIMRFCSELFSMAGYSRKRCSKLMNKFTLLNNTNAYANSQVCIVFAHVGVWCWVVQIGLLVLRIFCVTDFDLMLTTVVPKGKGNEPNAIMEDKESGREKELEM